MKIPIFRVKQWSIFNYIMQLYFQLQIVIAYYLILDITQTATSLMRAYNKMLVFPIPNLNHHRTFENHSDT